MITFTGREHERVVREALEAGKDPHTATAAWALEIPAEEVTRHQREQAKSLNYCLLYSTTFLATVKFDRGESK